MSARHHMTGAAEVWRYQRSAPLEVTIMGGSAPEALLLYIILAAGERPQ